MFGVVSKSPKEVLAACSIALVAELYLSGQMLKTPSRDPFADTADVDPQGRSLILVISGFSGARDFTLVLPDEKNSWLGVIPEAVASSHTMCGVICKALKPGTCSLWETDEWRTLCATTWRHCGIWASGSRDLYPWDHAGMT